MEDCVFVCVRASFRCTTNQALFIIVRLCDMSYLDRVFWIYL